mmetsp:Transcript_11037/g.42950  ORF Transcript_11037/g.42950 Transcript_11037/m.42950 type:complete len:312 (-) Transcript_11037:40-975(-)
MVILLHTYFLCSPGPAPRARACNRFGLTVHHALAPDESPESPERAALKGTRIARALNLLAASSHIIRRGSRPSTPRREGSGRERLLLLVGTGAHLLENLLVVDRARLVTPPKRHDVALVLGDGMELPGRVIIKRRGRVLPPRRVRLGAARKGTDEMPATLPDVAEVRHRRVDVVRAAENRLGAAHEPVRRDALEFLSRDAAFDEVLGARPEVLRGEEGDESGVRERDGHHARADLVCERLVRAHVEAPERGRVHAAELAGGDGLDVHREDEERRLGAEERGVCRGEFGIGGPRQVFGEEVVQAGREREPRT